MCLMVDYLLSEELGDITFILLMAISVCPGRESRSTFSSSLIFAVAHQLILVVTYTHGNFHHLWISMVPHSLNLEFVHITDRLSLVFT